MTTSFKAQLDAAYAKKVVGRLDEAVRFCGLSVLAYVKPATPVDTGRARSNWHLDSGAPTVIKVEPGQGQTDEEAQAAAGTYTGKDGAIHVSNNLPYIERLNDGYSQQAPAGFVQDAIQAAIAQTKARFK